MKYNLHLSPRGNKTGPVGWFSEYRFSFVNSFLSCLLSYLARLFWFSRRYNVNYIATIAGTKKMVRNKKVINGVYGSVYCKL